MKTYLKRPYEKSLASIFYSSSDTPSHFPSHANFRQRIVQPSTKEQQRLLSSSSSPKFQHVHVGKYGIRPLWSSDKSSCEQWQNGRKSSKHWSSSISKTSSRSNRDRCSHYKSDSQKKSILPSTSPFAFIDQQHASILILASVSLLLLLLIYIIYRYRRTKLNETKLTEQRRRQSLEDDLLNHEPVEYQSSTTRILPIIVEENPAILTPSSSYNKLTPLSTPTSSVITDDTDSRNSSTVSLQQRKSPANNIDDAESFVQIASLLKEGQAPASSLRRRSRFDNDSTQSTAELSPAEKEVDKPVIFRKFSTLHEKAIKDNFSSLEEINNAVKAVGLVHSQLMFGIDYTISNLETGKHSFNGRSLHHIQDGLLNPYQSVITIIGQTLEKFDSDQLIPAFGFGDRSTLDRKIFPLRPDGSSCKGFLGVLEAYNEITPKIRMSGPTNFAPLIREAIRIVKKTRQYHILVIVADGQVTNENQTKDAIVEASNYPLSIVMIGVGDGPWDMMNEFDDSLPTRQFDNFQFVNYNNVVQVSTNTESSFALQCLMEIPSQYAAIKELGLLKDS